jgi:hypothetical protein
MADQTQTTPRAANASLSRLVSPGVLLLLALALHLVGPPMAARAGAVPELA